MMVVFFCCMQFVVYECYQYGLLIGEIMLCNLFIVCVDDCLCVVWWFFLIYYVKVLLVVDVDGWFVGMILQVDFFLNFVFLEDGNLYFGFCCCVFVKFSWQYVLCFVGDIMDCWIQLMRFEILVFVLVMCMVDEGFYMILVVNYVDCFVGVVSQGDFFVVFFCVDFDMVSEFVLYVVGI